MKPPNSGPTTFDTIKTADTKARSVAAPVPVGEILVRTTTQSENMPEPPTPCSALKIMLQSHDQQDIICETDGSEKLQGDHIAGESAANGECSEKRHSAHKRKAASYDLSKCCKSRLKSLGRIRGMNLRGRLYRTHLCSSQDTLRLSNSAEQILPSRY